MEYLSTSLTGIYLGNLGADHMPLIFIGMAVVLGKPNLAGCWLENMDAW